MALQSDLKNLLQKYNLKPNKILGQNFLIDEKVLEKIIAAADLSTNDLVLEVGPGLGILTEALAQKAGKVITVEKDKPMAEILKSVLAKKNIRNVEIIEGDVLKLFLNLESRFLNQDFKLVANIPYYLTSHLIRIFLESINPPKAMILMLQKEVAQRICAQPPKMTLLSAAVQFYAKPQIISFVSKNSFWPAPKVDSAIIKISPTSADNARISPISAQQFFRVVHAGFVQPRKQLINNLSQSLKIDRAKTAEALKKIGLKPKQRAETLSIEHWIKLSKIL